MRIGYGVVAHIVSIQDSWMVLDAGWFDRFRFKMVQRYSLVGWLRYRMVGRIT